ncbi:MAG: hypothetical protein HY925_05525 [Elusimicrobia bacterium]|nr:hypothetical protein [Elusimicrobiota bacterium]
MAGLIRLIAFAAAWAAAPSPIDFRVRVEPQVLLPGQRLSIFAVWRNPAPAGGATIRVNRRGLLGHDVVVTVKAKDKPALALITPQDLGAPAERDFQLLGPGENFEYEYPVMLKSGGMIPPGSYDIRVVYKNEFPGPADVPAWTGRLEAKAKLRVPKPPGPPKKR